MSDSFKPYRDAYDNYAKDIEQLTGIGDRLVANARGVRQEITAPTAKLDKLKTIQVQIDKLPQAFKDAGDRFNAAIDAADAAMVEKTRAICSYAAGTGKGDAGFHYLLKECQAYDHAKGDFKRRRALYAQIVDLAASVADAGEKKSSSSDPGDEVLGRFEAISDPEDASAFHKKHRAAIFAAYEARKQNS